MRKKDGILNLLKKEAMNRRQLATELLCTVQMIDSCTKELKAEGLIYIAYWKRGLSQPTPYYRKGNQPDAPKLKPFTAAENAKRNEERRAKGIPPRHLLKVESVEEKFEPRRDIAANWF